LNNYDDFNIRNLPKKIVTLDNVIYGGCCGSLLEIATFLLSDNLNCGSFQIRCKHELWQLKSPHFKKVIARIYIVFCSDLIQFLRLCDVL